MNNSPANPPKDWQRIRLARPDITDYVVHFTKRRFDVGGNKTPPGRPRRATACDVLCEILDDGFIRPTFAPIRNKMGNTNNTVRGPHPAVCLTEQPLAAVLATRKVAGDRYSGYGIAYHKYALHFEGGHPVLYGPKSTLGRRIQPGEAGYEAGKDIHEGLPKEIQYLFVRYEPGLPSIAGYPIDFTWEREWRIKPHGAGLPVFLERVKTYVAPSAEEPLGAVVVERDEDVATISGVLKKKLADGATWPRYLARICSLETAQRMLDAGHQEYARIETWPDDAAISAAG